MNSTEAMIWGIGIGFMAAGLLRDLWLRDWPRCPTCGRGME